MTKEKKKEKYICEAYSDCPDAVPHSEEKLCHELLWCHLADNYVKCILYEK